ncbi:TPA: AAA family ATPase [Candidatus Woesearchaeota archaeon]|nr:AAA family ATPase [Candidatus Woesearchaeota archaeon]
MTTLIVTGTPGTGKTTVAKKLARLLDYTYIDVNNVISKHNLSQGYDRSRRCKIIDTSQLNKELRKIIKQHDNTIIDSHLSHFLPQSSVDLCLITRCNLKLLSSRLKRRGYPKSKIDENLEVELMEIIPNEVAQKGHDYIFVDTDKKIEYERLIKKIKRSI